jgi:hypothetical protein
VWDSGFDDAFWIATWAAVVSCLAAIWAYARLRKAPGRQRISNGEIRSNP